MFKNLDKVVHVSKNALNARYIISGISDAYNRVIVPISLVVEGLAITYAIKDFGIDLKTAMYDKDFMERCEEHKNEWKKSKGDK